MSKKYFIILFIILFSCNKKNKKYYYSSGELYSIVELDNDGRNHGRLKVMYKSGELKLIGNYIHGKKTGFVKSFFKTGKLKAIEKYKDGEWIDTTEIFNSLGKKKFLKYKIKNKIILNELNEQGITIAKGEVKDSLLTGWWEYYYNSSRIKKKIEYLKLEKDKQYINQTIFYNLKGEIEKDSSNYFDFDFPDTIPLNKLVIGKISLKSNISIKDNFYMVYFNSFNNKDITIDSTYGETIKPAKLWVKFNTIGRKKIKGYILEKNQSIVINKRDTSLVDIINTEHKMYFEKDIHVFQNYFLPSKYQYKKP